MSEEKEGQAGGEGEINFSTFIFSLSSSAFLHFGEMPDPQTGKRGINIPAAKQTIDILDMIQKKTKGNLTPDEEKLLDNMIYELRIKYMELSSREKGK